MKIFNIPEWDQDSGLTHYATTWVITSDSTGNNIVYQLDKSTTNLLGLDLNLEIPVGEVYYIKAMRYLKDSNGNDIVYNKWIGPTKLINDLSNQNDVLISKTYINTPYLIDSKVTVDKGLSLTIAPYSGDVPLKGTQIVIESLLGKEVYSHLYDNTTLNMVIPNSIYNFTTVEGFIIKIIHIGDLSTVSPVYKEKHSYIGDLYTIIGNLSEISPDTNTTLEVLFNKDIYTKLNSAVVKLLDDTVITNGDIVNNLITKIVIKYNIYA